MDLFCRSLIFVRRARMRNQVCENDAIMMVETGDEMYLSEGGSAQSKFVCAF